MLAPLHLAPRWDLFPYLKPAATARHNLLAEYIELARKDVDVVRRHHPF